MKDQNKEEELNSMKYIDILKYHSIDDLKEELIQRKVVQILKRSIRRMMRFFIETFTNDIIANTAELDMIEKMWDTRNLIVHQNGIIDLAYSKKYNLVKGNRVLVNNDFINDHYRNIEKLFSNIDKAAFKLP